MRSSIRLVIGALVAAGAVAFPQQSAAGEAGTYAFDFEDGIPRQLVVTHGTVTRDESELLAGRASLKIDTLGMKPPDTEAITVLETSPEVRLPPGRTYRVSFTCRLIQPDGLRGQVGLNLRSASQKEPVQWMTGFRREKEAVARLDALFPIATAADYRLYLTARSGMVVILDDLTIAPTTGRAPGDGEPIKSITPPPDPDVQWLDQLRSEQGLERILREQLVVVCNNAGRSVSEFYDQIIADLHPDFAHWCPLADGDNVATHYGIRTAVGGMEYDSYVPAEGESFWPRHWEIFSLAGYSHTYENAIIWGEWGDRGAYHTCHNGSKWHEVFLNALLANLKTYEGVAQDNIGCAAFDMPWHSRACFCPSCLSKFRDYLTRRYSVDELRRWGIQDRSTFDFRQRFVAAGRFGTDALLDPLAREYLKFQYRSHLDAWKDVVVQCKRMSAADRRLVPVMGNQYGGDGSFPCAVLLSQYNDVIEIEDVHDMYGDGLYRRTLPYKLGRASGFHRKPVWTRNAYPDPEHADLEYPSNSRLLHEMGWGEALANGGLHDFMFEEQAYHIQKPTWTNWPKLDARPRYEFYKKWARLLDENRAAFINPESHPQVAVVWSFPSMMWHDFPPYRIEAGWGFDPPPFWSKESLQPGQVPYRLHYGATALLDEMHVQHDFLVLGHPELLADDPAMAALASYAIIVLPYCPCLSDRQVQALQHFAASGHYIIRIGEVGVRDENWNPRGAPALPGIPMLDLLAERDQAVKLLRTGTDLTTDAGPRVSVNLWRIMSSKGVTVHLVNYDAQDVWHDRPRPTRPISLSFPKPPEAEVDSATMLTLMQGARRIPYEISEGRVRCTVPPFDAYAVVVFANKAGYEGENRAALERKRKDQEAVKAERQRLGARR